MAGLISGYRGFLLLGSSDDVGAGIYYKKDNPEEVLFVIIAAVVVIIVFIVLTKILGKVNESTVKKGAAGQSKFNGFKFRRLARSYGLNREQTHTLEAMFKENIVTDPERTIQSPALLDKIFKKSFLEIENIAINDEDAQTKYSDLFTLRNAIEAVPTYNVGVLSTNKIPDKTPAVLSTGKDSYTIRVINSKGSTLVTEQPKNALGSPVRIAKGTKITLSFFTKSSKGYSFDSRIIGSSESLSSLQVAHSETPKPLVSRRFRRKQINTRCTFYFVFLDMEKPKGKQLPKLTVDKRRFYGTMIDVSAGGCSIKATAPVQVGSRLKIEAACSEGHTISVLGQVLRTNKSDTFGTIIHIKFLKVPRRSFNNINALVFGFDDD